MMMVVVVVVVVMVMVMPVAFDHHRGPPLGMMMMMVSLSELDGALGPGCRAFIHRLERRRSVRDRLQQIGIGIGLKHVGWWRRGRRLYRADRTERGYRAKKAGDFLVHGVFSGALLPGTANQRRDKMFQIGRASMRVAARHFSRSDFFAPEGCSLSALHLPGFLDLVRFIDRGVQHIWPSVVCK